MSEIWRSKCGTIELRLGKWQDVLADVERCDAVITDPPYGQHTHEAGRYSDRSSDGADRRELSYSYLLPGDVAQMVGSWSGRCSGWFCSMTSDDLTQAWRSEYEKHNRQHFAPVPILQHRPRLVGDGPGFGAIPMMVARPRRKEFLSWGSLPCWYETGIDRGGHIGGKPVDVMCRIISDYSRPGDLIVDPCAGGATTLLAAAIEGRRAIGAECDPRTFELAVKRLEKGWTPATLFQCQPEMKQGGLL